MLGVDQSWSEAASNLLHWQRGQPSSPMTLPCSQSMKHSAQTFTGAVVGAGSTKDYTVRHQGLLHCLEREVVTLSVDLKF